MKTLTATNVSRNFSRVLDEVTHRGEEITITRNKQPVAKLVPGVPRMSALEALSDIYQTIDPDEGREWIEDIGEMNDLLSDGIKDPWE